LLLKQHLSPGAFLHPGLKWWFYWRSLWLLFSEWIWWGCYYDCETVIGFLRQYDLLNEFKLNIEVNHATLAGHTFQHE